MKYIDEEEKDLDKALASIDIDNIQKPSAGKQKKMKKSARTFVQKETKMNIRINPYELNKIKELADKEGLKYQTFVKSILHKYITGQLVENKHRR